MYRGLGHIPKTGEWGTESTTCAYFWNDLITCTMKRSFILITIGLTSFVSLGQCSTSIPNDALVGTGGSMTINGISYANIWVCAGSNIMFPEGEHNTFWLELGQNGVHFWGPYNTVYYKGDTPFANIVTSNNNTFYVSSSDLVSFGSSTTGNTVFLCPGGVAFDYTDAPEGCGTISGLDELSGTSFHVRYDPATDQIIADGQLNGLLGIQLLDITGRVLERISANACSGWSMSAFPAGCYIVQTIAKTGVHAQRFAKP